MRLFAVAAMWTLAGCAQPRPGDRLERRGDEIVVCGQFFHTGAPVTLWLDRGGYDAYRVHRRFAPNEPFPSDPARVPTPNRFDSFRAHLPAVDATDVRANGWSLDLLKKHVDLFVLHYDVCGTSRRCFEVLHDVRGLSVHFMLDLDGTIYQTLDLKERAWHAGPANDRSIGIEIANIGAYESPDELSKWYRRSADGRIVFEPPVTHGLTGLRQIDYIARPSRDEIVRGRIHERELYQYDLTDAQYESLIRLTATICRIFPRINPNAPRGSDGLIRRDRLSAAELSAFGGIVGHYHLSSAKVDPGPAFDWDRLLRGVRHAIH